MNASKPDSVSPLFFLDKEVPEGIESLDILEAAEAITKDPAAAICAKKNGSIWRLYASSEKNKTLIMSHQHLRFKNKKTNVVVSVKLYLRNPFLLRGGEGGKEIPTTRLTINGLPLSVSNTDLQRSLDKLGANTLSRIMWEHIRKRDNTIHPIWITGRRYVFIEVPAIPLGHKIEVGVFSGTLFYKEQGRPEITCFRCGGKGHRANMCKKDLPPMSVLPSASDSSDDSSPDSSDDGTGSDTDDGDDLESDFDGSQGEGDETIPEVDTQVNADNEQIHLQGSLPGTSTPKPSEKEQATNNEDRMEVGSQGVVDAFNGPPQHDIEIPPSGTVNNTEFVDNGKNPGQSENGVIIEEQSATSNSHTGGTDSQYPMDNSLNCASNIDTLLNTLRTQDQLNVNIEGMQNTNDDKQNENKGSPGKETPPQGKKGKSKKGKKSKNKNHPKKVVVKGMIQSTLDNLVNQSDTNIVFSPSRNESGGGLKRANSPGDTNDQQQQSRDHTRKHNKQRDNVNSGNELSQKEGTSTEPVLNDGSA